METLNVANTRTKDILIKIINQVIDDNQWNRKEVAHVLQIPLADISLIKRLNTASFSLDVCRRDTKDVQKEQTECKSYAIDEGGPLGAGLQEQASNNHKLLW